MAAISNRWKARNYARVVVVHDYVTYTPKERYLHYSKWSLYTYPCILLFYSYHSHWTAAKLGHVFNDFFPNRLNLTHLLTFLSSRIHCVELLSVYGNSKQTSNRLSQKVFNVNIPARVRTYRHVSTFM